MSRQKLKQLNGGTIAGSVIANGNAAGDVSVLKHNLIATTDPGSGDDSGDGYAVGSIWVNITGDKAFICVDATTSSAVWRLMGASDTVAGNRTGVDLTFYDSSTEYIEITSGTDQVVASFIYPGSAAFVPSSIKGILSRSSSSGTSYVSIHDLTNGNLIGEISYVPDGKAIYTQATLSNLPTGEAMFELRARKSGGGKTRIHFVQLR